MQISQNATALQGAGSAARSDATAMKFDAALRAAPDGLTQGASETGASGAGAPMEGIAQVLEQLQHLLEQLKALIESLASRMGGGAQGASTPTGGGGGVRAVEGGAGLGDSNIPKPTEFIREVQLGGKTVTIGGDGSASEQDVNAVAAELQNMYAASPGFAAMIDGSPHKSMSLAVGKRGDNTSWGGGGSVFMNLNNIQAGPNDTFQELMAHEFGHAVSDLGHGAELESLEARVAAEA